MRTLETANRLGQLCQFLADKDFEIEELTDLSTIGEIANNMDKPYLTPMSSADHNDFTEMNHICLVARKNGKPIMMGCARLEDIGAEPVSSYWTRVFTRAYGAPSSPPVISNINPEVERNFTRKLVYFGDLFVAKGGRGNRSALRAFVAIGHLAVSLKWDPDWIYCFIRERDLMLGASAMYGFNRDFGSPFEWVDEPPHPRNRSEQLVALSRTDIPMVTGRTLVAVAEKTLNDQ